MELHFICADGAASADFSFLLVWQCMLQAEAVQRNDTAICSVCERGAVKFHHSDIAAEPKLHCADCVRMYVLSR